MNKKYTRMFAGIMGASLVVHGETVELPDLVVTPMRRPHEAAAVPGSMYVLSRDDLARLMPRTTPEALEGIPSVMIQKTSYGQGSPFIRGFTGFRTLTLIDGIRLNNSIFRDGPNQYMGTIDPFSIDRYELVLGPASVLYGSDAVGGALNALTPGPLTWLGQTAWESALIYRGATADQSHQARMETAGRLSEALALRAGYSWKSFDDVRGGRDVGKQPKTGYDETAWDTRLDYLWSSGATLTLGHQQVRQEDAWRTHRTPFGIDWKGLKQGDDQVHRFDQNRDLTWLRLAHTDRGDSVDAYTLTLSRHQQAEDLERLRENGRLDKQGFDVVTWGAALILESVGSAGHWVYGIDYYRDVVDSYSTRTDPGASLRKARQGPVADDATYDLVGVFLQNTATTRSGVEITPGIRYTYAGLDADKVDQRPDGLSDSWDAVVGSLRVLLPLDEERRQAVHAGVSQGFRAPNLSDMTRLDSARSTELETPVDRLDPERFTTSEIGWRHSADRWSAGVAYYYTWIDDMIVRAPTGNRIEDLDEVTKKNAGGGHVQGVELTAQFQMAEDWIVRVMGMWMEGKVRSYPTSAPVRVEDDISRVMPLTGQLALRWQPKGRSFWVEGIVDAADKADRLSADDERDTQRIPPGGTPGYVVGSLRTGYDLSRSISITVAFENLTNEDYRIHGSGVNEPGRQVVAQVTGRF